MNIDKQIKAVASDGAFVILYRKDKKLRYFKDDGTYAGEWNFDNMTVVEGVQVFAANSDDLHSVRVTLNEHNIQISYAFAKNGKLSQFFEVYRIAR